MNTDTLSRIDQEGNDVVDFGNIDVAVKKGGIRMKVGTGVLWRIHRTGVVTGSTPPKPLTLPIYLMRLACFLLAGIGLAFGVSAILKKRPRK